MSDTKIPEAAEESFLDDESRLIHAELWFDQEPHGLVSTCQLTVDSEDHDYRDTPCSSLSFALDHGGLDCDDAPNCLVEVDLPTLHKIHAWALSKGY